FDFSVINGEVYEVDPENAGVTLTIDDTPQTVDEVVFDFEWTGQIARFNVTGQFSYDQNQTYTDGIVREEDLLGFDISFFAPDGTLLRTYEDNHLTFPEFNFAYDTNTGEILQDGAFMGEEGFNVGEKTPVGDGTFTGLSFFSRPELNPQGEVPPPHLHIDDWSDEFGFPLGFSTHEDVAFFTRTTQQLLDTGRMGEAYIDDVQDSLDEFGERIQVSFVDDSFIPVFGSLGGDTIEVDGGNQLVFGGAEDDLIDASLTSETGNRIYGQSGDDTLILGTGDRALGGDGDDRFFVLSDGDNLITGGAGMDQFWIATAEIPEEINTITDFTSGEDVIGLAGLGIGFADLSITQQDADTLIALGNDELAKLLGINAGSLSAADFAFAASL
ncbi:calcium-binding protein, partial [Crocosphaera watsonii]